MPKLSFIIPVYNGENYIETCLNSILKEKEFDFEVVVVDDGSIDNSKAIIEEYSIKDSRVKFHSVSHRGLSMTRNYGLKQATGDYINFIDIDDYISDDYFKVINNNLGNDLLVFGYQLLFVDEKYKILIEGKNKVYLSNEKDELVKDMFNLDIFNFAWNKVYKREILTDLTFSDDFYQGEDLAFNCEAIKRCDTFRLIEECLYVYVKRNIETMANKFVKNYSLVLKNKQQVLKDLFNCVDPSEKYIDVFNDYMLKEYEVFVINLYKSNNYKNEDRINLIQENILNEEAISQIISSTPTSTYSKIFKSVAKRNNAKLINRVYKTLYGIKNNLGDSYLKLRKKIYLKDDKKSSINK